MALELDEDLSERAELATQKQQFEHRPQLRAIFTERFATNSTDYWVKRLEEQDILCAPVHSLAQALTDEQTLVNELVLEMGHPTAGKVKALDAPIRLSATPARVRRVPPRLGEHTAEVLREHGYDESAVTSLNEAVADD